MAASVGVTNKGKWALASLALTGAVAGLTTSFKAMLCTNANAPDVDDNTVADLTEVANGNGYTTGGITIEKSAVGWDALAEDDSGDKATCKMKDAAWTASGGSIVARYMILTDDNATVASRNVYAWWELADGADVTVTDGQTLTVQDAGIDLTTPA
ncbi:MAG: hypothetical protein JRE40_00880 [Deltaproteobacteria bacterium]|nr:hypothetical protein [Deltaproteobacteria bacterium]